MAYVVKAPYVVLKVVDLMSGGRTMRGFYAGAIVPADVDEANLRHHLDDDMVVEVAGPPPAEPEPKAPAAKPVKATG